MIELYVEFSEADDKMWHFIKWVIGWMYLGRIKFRCVEVKCGGCVWLSCGKFELFDLWKLEIEGDINVFDLALSLGLDVARLLKDLKTEVKIGICKGDECIDVNLKDIERWWNVEVWDVN